MVVVPDMTANIVHFVNNVNERNVSVRKNGHVKNEKNERVKNANGKNASIKNANVENLSAKRKNDDKGVSKEPSSVHANNVQSETEKNSRGKQTRHNDKPKSEVCNASVWIGILTKQMSSIIPAQHRNKHKLGFVWF